MADKFLYINSGVPTEKEATVSSAGAGDAGKVVALDTGGKLSTTMMPAGIASDSSDFEAAESLQAGNIVNLYDSSGTIKARKADATSAGKEACGFVTSNVSEAGTATVYFDGQVTGMSGLTAGSIVYLSTSPGLGTSTPPSSAGNVVQSVGRALSTSSMSFEIGQVFIKA